MKQSVINAQGMNISSDDEQAIRRQLRRSLGRFSPYVGRISLYIKDINGPKGGADINVVVRTRLRGRVEVASSAQRSQLLAATSSAIRKTRRQIKKAVRRQQEFGRMSFGNRALLSQSDW